MSDALDESTIDWDVEMTAEVADRAEEILRDFATDAELEIALVVEKSGAMIAGVAAREDVDVATIGALVAGAFGTMGALSRELGEVELTESFHHGENDLLYMRRLGDRYILLGVTDASAPAGLIRESAAQVVGMLAGILQDDEEDAEEAPEFEGSPFQEADDDGVEIVREQEDASPPAEEPHEVPMPVIDPAVRPQDSETDKLAEEISPAKPAKSPRYVFEIG